MARIYISESLSDFQAAVVELINQELGLLEFDDGVGGYAYRQTSLACEIGIYNNRRGATLCVFADGLVMVMTFDGRCLMVPMSDCGFAKVVVSELLDWFKWWASLDGKMGLQENI